MQNSITSRIFDIIERNNLSQNQLAQTLGITRNNISEWKSGSSEPSPKIILKIIFHFPEVDANWLIRGTTKEAAGGNVQSGTRNRNTIGNITIGNEAADIEIKHLKAIIKEKEAQIEILRSVLQQK